MIPLQLQGTERQMTLSLPDIKREMRERTSLHIHIKLQRVMLLHKRQSSGVGGVKGMRLR